MRYLGLKICYPLIRSFFAQLKIVNRYVEKRYLRYWKAFIQLKKQGLIQDEFKIFSEAKSQVENQRMTKTQPITLKNFDDNLQGHEVIQSKPKGYAKLQKQKLETKLQLQFIREKEDEQLQSKLQQKRQFNQTYQSQAIQKELEQKMQIIKELEEREQQLQREASRKSSLSQRRVIKKREKKQQINKDQMMIDDYINSEVDLNSLRVKEFLKSPRNQSQDSFNEKLKSQDLNTRSPISNYNQRQPNNLISISDQFNQTTYLMENSDEKNQTKSPSQYKQTVKSILKKGNNSQVENQQFQIQDHNKPVGNNKTKYKASLTQSQQSQEQRSQERTKKSEEIRQIIKQSLKTEKQIEKDQATSKIKENLKLFNEKVRLENKQLKNKQQILDQNQQLYQYDNSKLVEKQFDFQENQNFNQTQESVLAIQSPSHKYRLDQSYINQQLESYRSPVKSTNTLSRDQSQFIVGKVDRNEIQRILDDISNTVLIQSPQREKRRVTQSNHQTKKVSLVVLILTKKIIQYILPKEQNQSFILEQNLHQKQDLKIYCLIITTT
eukprot:403369627